MICNGHADRSVSLLNMYTYHRFSHDKAHKLYELNPEKTCFMSINIHVQQRHRSMSAYNLYPNYIV